MEQNKRDKIYIVTFKWATEDEIEVEEYPFKTIESAKKKYATLIANEKDPDISWVGGAIDENGLPQEGYCEELSQGTDHQFTWSFWEDGYYNSKHSTISILTYDLDD